MNQPQLSLDLAPHEQQLGKYRLVAKLGQGGMGTVYLALASGLGSFRKILVVKELRHDLPWKENSLTMFMDEAQLAARLDHPNVLQTFEAGEADGRYFLAMEYLDGQPLSAVIDRALDRGGIPLELHVHILCEVLSGLQYAHDLTDYDGTRLHVVHRDVSPQNVFITHHGQVKVVDFGVAKANNASNSTSPGVFKGKFAYAAPEQLQARPVDGRCDVFAVGVMLWEAIARQRFGVPKPSVDAFRIRTHGLEPKITDVAPDVDPLLAEICEAALKVNPLERVESAAALRERLQQWLLLQGEHLKTEDVAAFMRELFSRERSERRRVIERAMEDAGASQSVIAALPRELVDRESGSAPRIELQTEPPAAESTAASGINPSSRQGSTRADTAPTRPLRISPGLSSTPLSRLGSAAVLVGLAVGVFGLTYLVSRKATQPTPAPQSDGSRAQATSPAAETPRALPEASPMEPIRPTVSPAVSGARPLPQHTTTIHAARDPDERPQPESESVFESVQDGETARRASSRHASPSGSPHGVETLPASRSAPSRAIGTQPPTVTPKAKPARQLAREALRHTMRADTIKANAPRNTQAQRLGEPMRQAAAPRSAAGAKPRAAAPAGQAEPNMGSDLRRLRNNGPMRIDTEDPYQ